VEEYEKLKSKGSSFVTEAEQKGIVVFRDA